MNKLPYMLLFALAYTALLGTIAGMLLNKLDGVYYVSSIAAIIGAHAVAHTVTRKTITSDTTTSVDD